MIGCKMDINNLQQDSKDVIDIELTHIRQNHIVQMEIVLDQ